jgi:hypothetical protein
MIALRGGRGRVGRGHVGDVLHTMADEWVSGCICCGSRVGRGGVGR